MRRVKQRQCNLRPALPAIYLFDRDMVEFDSVYNFLCVQESNICVHPSCLCLLSLRTGQHVNTTNPQVAHKCQMIRLLLESLCRCRIQLYNQCLLCSLMISPIRVEMYTVMSDLLNEVLMICYVFDLG